MMQKEHSNKADVKMAYSGENGMGQKATAPDVPATAEQVAPLSMAVKACWFLLGVFGGIFAMIAKLALPCKLPFEQRKQSEWAVWAGFAVNTFILVVLINTGCIDALIAGLNAPAAGPTNVSPAFG